MALLRFKDVAQNWEITVGSVKQPEISNIGGRKIGERLILLPARSGERIGLGRQHFNEPAQYRHQVVTHGKIDHWRYELRIQLVSSGRRLLDPRDSQRGASLPGFALHQDAEVLFRNLNRPLRESRVLVAQHGDFG